MSQLSKKLTGTGVAMVTPFKKDGSVDFSSLGKLTDHIVKDGCEYLVPLGTTGESATLNTKEKVAILEYIKERNNNRIPIVLGLGGNNTMEVINEFRNFNFIGISAILSVSPAYNKPTQAGIYQHYKMIAAESPVPVILYNVPGRTASNMTAETTLSLAHDVKNIIGIKEASGNIEQCMFIIKDKPKDFLVISGDDSITLPLIGSGADGVISVLANAYPKVFSEMVRKALKHDFTKAQQLHYQLLKIIPMLFAEGNPAGVKCALSAKKICEQFVRLPLVPVSKKLESEMVAFIKKNSPIS